MISGGQAVVQALLAAGVDHAFCVPGESFLGLLDALYDAPQIRVIATRHEGGAAFMAEAFGKLTRRPAVCMGTRMVGGGNLAIGIHTAHQDSSPMLALLGQVATGERHREAFQETELAQVFAPIAKWTVEPPRADRLGELTLRGARAAISGRPGPVVISLREDLLAEQVPDFAPEPLTVSRPGADPHRLGDAMRVLRAAERPLMILGGGVLASQATDLFVRLAETEQIPVTAAWRRPDVFPNEHPLFLGHGGLGAPRSVVQRLLDADVILAVGTRLNEMTSQAYRIPGTGTRLIHVDVWAEGLGGHRPADVPIQSDAALFAEAFLATAAVAPAPASRLEERRRRNATDRQEYEANATASRGRSRPGFLDQQALAAQMRCVLPPDAVVTTDAGNFGGWPARFLRWQKPGTFLGPTSGAMGYSVPAAIAAKLARPERPVVSLVGDGGFLMTGTEVETAVREQVPIVVLVYDNAQYGTIRMHQERDHPGRQIATALGAVDFAAMARALGAAGVMVRDEQEFGPLLQDALHAATPTVFHLRVDPEQISVASDVA
jgi:acetolactate synthase I/II/III large subunit